jgi:hypothetical protein
MLKKFVLVSALVAAPAFAQQNTDISGAQFLAGQGDATLATLGRQAASSGKRLVITAPAEWHARIAAKVRAGGNADVVLRDGFYENVLVRIEDKGAKAAGVDTERSTQAEVEKSKAEAAKAKAEAERIRAEAERAKAEAEALKAEAEKAKAEAEMAKAQAAQAAARPAAAPAPVAAPAPAASAPAKPAPAATDAGAIRAKFEQTLMGGRAAEGDLAVDALQSGDTLYVDGPVRAVVRREGLRAVLYWLDGELDLRRSELKVLADNRYQVLAAIRGEGTLRREFGDGKMLEARPPADDAPVRAALERDLNDGRRIDDTIAIARLRHGDVIYVGENAAVVVRRDGKSLLRFWLEGELDLTQPGLAADGANKYKVLRDTVR